MIDERLLIKRIKAGDKSAYRLLLENQHKRVIHICLSFVQQSEDAEDIAQEVFIEVFRSIESYRADASLSTWLYRLAVNKSLDFIRQKKRKKRGYGLQTSFDDKDINVENQMTQLSISDALEEKDRVKILHSAMALLPERQRVALTLSKLDELSQKEVAKILEVSEGSVESLLVRARKKLKEILMPHKEQIL